MSGRRGPGNIATSVAPADNTTTPTLLRSVASFLFGYDGATWDFLRATSGALNVVEQQAPQAEDNTNGVIAQAWKPLNSATYAPTLYAYFAGAVTGQAIKASAGNIFSIHATNTNAAVRYLQLHNATAKPAGGATPAMVFFIPAGNSVVVDQRFFTQAGARFTTGITWTVSTTIATFTDGATANEHTVHATYI